MKHRENFRQKKNSGFTLVELLVAVTILAIITVPLLRVFVAGAQANAKSRQVLRGTTAAQNLMEEIKASNVANIARSVNGCSQTEEKGFPERPTGFEAVKSSSTYSAVEEDDSCLAFTKDADEKVVRTDFKRGTGNYTFVLPDITLESIHYDAVVEFKLAKSIMNAKINSMNADTCMYFMQDGNMNVSVARDFQERNATLNGGEAVINYNSFLETVMSRTIKLDVVPNAVTNNVKTTITYTYDAGSGNTQPLFRLNSSVESIVKDTQDSALEAIYVYYYPLYTNNGIPRDSFEVNNMSNLDIDIFFISLKDDTYTTFDEAGYSANLSVNESIHTGEAFHTTVCSNIKDSKWKADSTALEVGPLANYREEAVLYDVKIRLYKHNDSSLTSVSFTPDEKDFVTEFTGSLVDNSK